MKIRNIRLENIKVFTDFNLSFTDNNTNEPHNAMLIVGENGTGKSTILKAIASCFTINNSLYGGDVFRYEDV